MQVQILVTLDVQEYDGEEDVPITALVDSTRWLELRQAALDAVQKAVKHGEDTGFRHSLPGNIVMELDDVTLISR